MSWRGVTDEWAEKKGRGKHFCDVGWTAKDSHVLTPTEPGAVELGNIKTHASHCTHANAHYTQPAPEGRFNHGDTHLRAVAAAWRRRRLQPSLDVRRDEQSER